VQYLRQDIEYDEGSLGFHVKVPVCGGVCVFTHAYTPTYGVSSRQVLKNHDEYHTFHPRNGYN